MEQDDGSCDLAGSLSPLKDYSEWRLKVLKKKELSGNCPEKEELLALEQLSAMTQSSLKLRRGRVLEVGETARFPHVISKGSDFLEREMKCPSAFKYSKERRSKQSPDKNLEKTQNETEKGPDVKTWCDICKKNFCNERYKKEHMMRKHGIGHAGLTSAPVWRLDVSRRARDRYAQAGGANDFLQEQLLASVPEDFGWVLRYVSACFECPVFDVYWSMQQAERLALEGDPTYFGAVSGPTGYAKNAAIGKNIEK